jgi:hypothetical protein
MRCSHSLHCRYPKHRIAVSSYRESETYQGQRDLLVLIGQLGQDLTVIAYNIKGLCHAPDLWEIVSRCISDQRNVAHGKMRIGYMYIVSGYENEERGLNLPSGFSDQRALSIVTHAPYVGNLSNMTKNR